ncbi:aspartic proteinase nepenthesin-1-like [Impatiens glandulifera]|uniref:aspartic proteinase nepenthesin-1-like n=1 Tax=Impatiens glandulifera TaxID=253017 RepID=UPI001FB192A1|nr:aspartic proteinase nepenthesin-1-like [Impatiens glandulifera]
MNNADESIGFYAPINAGGGEFLMNFSIGTPVMPISAILDTGSDLIWVDCDRHHSPSFSPIRSSTGSNISCYSDACSDLNTFKCQNEACTYLYSYGDGSSSEGFLATETFTFGGPVSIPNVTFGCGVINQGPGLSLGSGLVGLGRGPLSLVSQLGLTKFSYCLSPIGENKTSSIVFGSLAEWNSSTRTKSNHSATPLIQNSFQTSFYYVGLEGITVGETLLPIPKEVFEVKEDGSGGMIVDSGTTLTYLHEEAFRLLKKEFTSQMRLRVSTKSDTTGMDLCFDLPGKDRDFGINNDDNIDIPKVKFHFKGMDLELPSENYIVGDMSLGVVCLAMAASNGMSIFGNIQQQNFLVVHDLDQELLSFVPTQCDQF